MKATLKISFLKILNILISLTPLIILCIINWDRYFATHKASKIDNIIGFGGIIIILILIILKQTKIFKTFLGWWIITIIMFALRYILQDLVAIMFCASIGMTISAVVFQPIIAREEKIKDKKETAEINAGSMEQTINKVIESINGRG